jgi:hypothetical protein
MVSGANASSERSRRYTVGFDAVGLHLSSRGHGAFLVLVPGNTQVSDLVPPERPPSLFLCLNRTWVRTALEPISLSVPRGRSP